ncbi:MAG TPA: PilC/PilY family type IV pilus protein [Gammaproteobacteria bacterium]|nr:PilC/PilY family type IV pilus protein [Gammaproteobacteria bacterium]
MSVKMRFLLSLALLAVMATVAAPGASAAVSISQSPLFLTISMPPNIAVLLDDSGSMAWAYAPDSMGGNASARVYVSVVVSSSSCTGSYSGLTHSKVGNTNYCNGYKSFSSVSTPDTFHYKSSSFNPLYYNPSVVYTAPYQANGTQYTTSFTAAYYDGFDTANGTVDLSASYRATETYTPGSTTGDSANNGCNYFNISGSCSNDTAQAAFYYTYTPTASSATANGCTSSLTDDGCYTKVTVSSSSGPGGTDERQNFANWYSFYRTRHFTVVSSADIAFNSLSQTYRVAWIDLHSCAAFDASSCKGWPSSGTYDNRIGVFTGQHRTDFFNWLSRFPASGGTNLRQALDVIGNYYTTSGVDSPYAFTPHQTDSPEYVCRPNYAIALTDGLWNESTGNLSVQPGNADNTAVTLPDGTAFPAKNHPYSDSNSNTLADVAFHYWSTNLRPDLGTSPSLQYMPYNKNVSIKDSSGTIANVTPYWNAQNDPAQWPHMVTFTVGLGLSSVLSSAPKWGGSTYAGGYNDLVTGKTAWPSSFSCGDVWGSCTDPIGNVYDLWHAAIDGRGEFFAADTPQDVTLAFNSLVTRIQGRVGSSSAIAVNSTKLDSNTLIYQAQFNSSDWSGDVLAYSINSDGSIGSQAWQASTLIPAASSRNILSWDATNKVGINFLWTSLTTSEQTALNNNIFGVADGNGSARVTYLRGDQSQEQSNGGIFRTRSQILGDIVNSNPFYVGSQDFGFDILPEGATLMADGVTLIYDDFVTQKKTRTPMLYVGANDGMLHAFNANTGVEIFDYVPRGVYANLPALTDPTYTHQYYVDGSPESVDAFYGSTPAWHSLLAGTAGAGAHDVFLLDVTNPTSMTATNVVYDYDGVDGLGSADPNMGYVLGQPSIARMHDGDWYMIWGNGVNSTNQRAVLYMYNINTGSLLTFDSKSGSSTSPNGMFSPAPVDYDGDRIADAIYAGDLLGHMWKIDVSSTNSSQWDFSFKSGSTPQALFTATDANGNVQPITDRPQVGLSSTGSVMVYFGTGTYFQTGDNSVAANPPVMSFYGIIDDATNQVLRSNLLQQSIVLENSVNGTNFRVTTAYTLSSTQQGWYLDLNYPTAQGERVVSNPVLDNGRVIFTTLIPQGNACEYGGISWLMELNGDTGGQLTVSPFDVNGDGKVNTNDYVTVTYTDPKTGQSVTSSVPVSGKQSDVGIIQTPGIISAGELEYKYYSGSSGKIGMTVESTTATGGRLSWQQLP